MTTGGGHPWYDGTPEPLVGPKTPSGVSSANPEPLDELATLRLIIDTLPRNIHGDYWSLAVDAAYRDVQQQIDRMISERGDT